MDLAVLPDNFAQRHLTGPGQAGEMDPPPQSVVPPQPGGIVEQVRPIATT